MLLVLRNRLKYALTYREVKLIVMQRLVKVDHQVRTDHLYPIGFQGSSSTVELHKRVCPHSLTQCTPCNLPAESLWRLHGSLRPRKHHSLLPHPCVHNDPMPCRTLPCATYRAAHTRAAPCFLLAGCVPRDGSTVSARRCDDREDGRELPPDARHQGPFRRARDRHGGGQGDATVLVPPATGFRQLVPPALRPMSAGITMPAGKNGYVPVGINHGRAGTLS